MDLDNFKEVNHTDCHAAGDNVLKKLSGLLKAALRVEDVIIRVGGDEFAFLLEGMDGRKSLLAAEHLRVAGTGVKITPVGLVLASNQIIGK
jgi:diguanylate cyclase (GGDEF)-like protein